jgi:sulfate adenylyltransferase subunit 1 (EFTu-like GTPase family)
MSVTVRLGRRRRRQPRRHDRPGQQRAQAEPGHRRDGLLDDQRAAAPAQKLAIKHTTRTGRALVKDIQYRLDVNSLHRDQETKELGLNEIGRVQLRTTVPLLCDPYSKNRTTGSFILIDEATGVTVGAGMINSGM